MIAIMSHPAAAPGRAGGEASPPGDWPPELRRLAQSLSVRSGQSLFHRGETPHRVYWVDHGELRLQRTSADGRIIVLQRVRQGFLAEASLQAPAYHCDGWVAQDGLLWQFPRDRLLGAMQASAPLALWWATRLAQQLRDARRRCERLALRSARDRVLHAVDTEGQGGALQLPPLRKDWADELGLTPEALYRTLAALRREGVLVLDGNTLSRT